MPSAKLLVTYVTDPDLDPAAQRQVIEVVVSAPSAVTRRIAFRLPDQSDEDLASLINWYLELLDSLPGNTVTNLLPPLIHNRSAVAARFPCADIWIPSRHIGGEVAAGQHLACSVHSEAEAMKAMAAMGPQELVVGHIFPTESHPEEHAKGTGLLSSIANHAASMDPRALITAIGGINPDTIPSIGSAGIRSVAIIRALSRSPDIAATIAAIQLAWSESYSSQGVHL